MSASRGGGFVDKLLPELPEARIMALATLVNTTGNGMFMVVSVLYFTRIVGIDATRVGVGLTIAGLFGVLAGVPLGHLADRRGPRELLIALLVLCGFAFGSLIFVTNWWMFVLFTSMATVLDRGSAAVRAGLIATSVHGADRIRTRAYLRSITNVGLAVGAALAAFALHFDNRAAYVVVLLANALSCWFAAWVLRRYRHVAAIPRARGAAITTVFRDRPYVVLTALMAAMAIQYSILDIAMPLWVTTQTSAPRVLVSVLFIINTFVVVLFQVGVSLRVENATIAARAISASGLVFFGACVAFAYASDRSPAWAVALLVAAALLHVMGELMQAAAHFCLSQDLALEHAQGQYQGLTSTGFSLSTMLAPSVMVLLPIGLGVAGWWILGAIFAVLGFALVPVIRWTAATRGRYSLAG